MCAARRQAGSDRVVLPHRRAVVEVGAVFSQLNCSEPPLLSCHLVQLLKPPSLLPQESHKLKMPDITPSLA